MSYDYEPIMKRLVRTVMHLFYEPQHVVIADILLEAILLSDAEFCARMRMLNKEFNKLIVRLKDDHLVKYDIKVDVQENNRQLLRTLYFFNYAEVKDIIKYKIFKMTKILEERIKVADECFHCKTCDRVYSALDAQASMDGFVFKCAICRDDLEEHVVEADETGIDLKELMNSLSEVILLLKEADTHTIPAMDYFQVLEMKREREAQAAEKSEEEKKSVEQISSPALMLLDNDLGENDDAFEEEDISPVSTNPQVRGVDEMLTVNGVKRRFSEITEDDKDAMDEEEYTRYFEIYSKRQEL